MSDDDLIADAKRLIDALSATPRFAGGAAEARARELCAEKLKEAGLAPRELLFQFSQWPGRFGIPLIAGFILAGILAVAAVGVIMPATSRTSWSALSVQGVVCCIAYMGLRFGLRRRDSATDQMQACRTLSANLEATRGEARVWLVAHLDSKSQSIPMLVRVASHIALMAVLVSAVAAAVLAAFGWIEEPHWILIAALAVVAALPSLLCFVGDRSPGALDNATGVAAVLLAARLIPKDKPLGVLITSGEELDLAGARAWATRCVGGGFALSASKPVMINCDTVDDDGHWRCMWVNRPHTLGVAAGEAAKKLGLPLRMGKVIPGIITDSLAFDKAGLSSVTISRGTLQTLARLHTRRDNPDHLSGAGAATAARLLAGMVEELS